MLTNEEFIKWAEGQIETSRGFVRSFAEELTASIDGGNPAREMDNCDRVFEYAARISVLSSCVAALRKSSATTAGLKSRALFNVHRAALSGTGSRSTSTTGNWMAQCLAAAWGDVVTVLGGVEP